MVVQLPGGHCPTTSPLPHGKHFTPPDSKMVFKEQEKMLKMTQQNNYKLLQHVPSCLMETPGCVLHLVPSCHKINPQLFSLSADF